MSQPSLATSSQFQAAFEEHGGTVRGTVAPPKTDNLGTPNAVSGNEGGDNWEDKADSGDSALKAGPVASIPQTAEDAATRAMQHGFSSTYEYKYNEADFQSQSWRAHARVYEWKDEYGDVPPEDPELEEELFGTTERVSKGDRLDELLHTRVEIEGASDIAPVKNVGWTSILFILLFYPQTNAISV